MGKTSLKIPYKLSFNTIAARIILPDKGDSTCALSNQVFKKIVGVLTAKAKNTPANKNIWVELDIFPFAKASKSVVPIKEDIANIANNKNRDPNNVYKNKYKLARTLLSDPNNPISKKSGGNVLSKNT